jgi:hypothetical protein
MTRVRQFLLLVLMFSLFKRSPPKIDNPNDADDSEDDFDDAWTSLHGYNKIYEINMATFRVRKSCAKNMLRVSSTGRIFISGKWVHIADVVSDHRQSISVLKDDKPSISPLRIDTWVNMCLVSFAAALIWNQQNVVVQGWSTWYWTLVDWMWKM